MKSAITAAPAAASPSETGFAFFNVKKVNDRLTG
jgi:hypothetical protein